MLFSEEMFTVHAEIMILGPKRVRAHDIDRTYRFSGGINECVLHFD